MELVRTRAAVADAWAVGMACEAVAVDIVEVVERSAAAEVAGHNVAAEVAGHNIAAAEVVEHSVAAAVAGAAEHCQSPEV